MRSSGSQKTGLQAGVSEDGLQFVLTCNNAFVSHCLFMGSWTYYYYYYIKVYYYYDKRVTWQTMTVG